MKRSWFSLTLTALMMAALGWYILSLLQSTQSEGAPRRGHLTLGWESFYPYQVVVEGDEGNSRRLSGLDTELMREAFQRAGYSVTLIEKDWSSSLRAVRRGELQGLSMAIRLPEREQFAYYSRPYLQLRSAVFYRLEDQPAVARDAAGLRRLVLEQGYRLGKARDYGYPQALAQLLETPEVRGRTREAALEADNLPLLLSRELDLVLADELAGTSVVLKNGWSRSIGCTVLDYPAMPVHVLFSKKTVSPQVVAHLDEAIGQMETSGTTAQIVRAYYYPTLLNLLAQSLLFDGISILATATAAISGIVLARKEGYSLVGAFVLAAAPAAGGGLLRDLVSGRHPVGVVANPAILSTVVWLVLLAYLVFRLLPRPYLERLEAVDVDNHPVLVFFDSLGLAAFTILGVLVALQTRCEPLWLWGPLLAALTNGGGSVLRDVIRSRDHSPVLTTSLYVEVSAIWGFFFAWYLIGYSGHPISKVAHLQWAMAATALGVLVTRFLVLRLRLRSPGL